MTAWLPDRDAADADALVADRYLDALLAAGERRAADAPADVVLEPAIRDATRVLRAALVRVHPSFRFEERLGARLAELAASVVRDPDAPGTDAAPASIAGRLVPFAPPPPALVARDPDLPAIAAGELDPAAGPGVSARQPVPRPVLVGGAVASAALSVVGVALVAWRALRSSGGAPVNPMVRAARLARRRRATPGLVPGRLA